MSLFKELQRRNVIRVATAYVVASWLIIQVVETIFPVYGLGDAAIRTVITLLAVAFIPSLIFSWIFEITPEGLKREVEVTREKSITRFTGKKLDRIIMVLLALAVGYFAFDKFVLDPIEDDRIAKSALQEGRSFALTESYGDRSIAVLPFVNLSDDAEQEYFSDGLAEELLNLLSRIPDLRVISRSSAFSFKGKDITVPEIARQLNVAHVLEGSVRRSGEQLRITVQLIEAKSDTHLWAETYDREFADVFTVQEDIAWAITGALKSQLGTGVADGQLERPVLVPAANTAAYDAFLRGRELMRARGGENLQHAVEEFERALRLDEHFAPAHALLSIAHLLGVDWGELDTEDAIPTAVAHLDRASQLQPDLPEVLAGQALLASVLNEPASAIEHAGKALAVNPNDAFVMNMLQIFLADMGRYDESFAVAGRMMVIDPLSPIGRLNYCWLLGDRGRLAEARTIANQMLEEKLSLGYLAHAILSIWYEGELADGLSWVLRWGSDNIWVVYTFSLIREPDEARRVSERLAFYSDWYEQNWDEAIEATQQILANNPNSHWAYRNAADSYYFAHRFEEALPLFERSLDFVPKDRPIKQPHRLDRTVAAAVSRRMAGDDLGAEELIEIAEKDLAARRSAGIDSQLLYWAEAMIAAFGGETERALAALDASIEWGLRDWLIFEDPVFDALRENTRFVGLQQKLDDILAQEREKVLRLICLENPVPDDWRPLPETCDGIAYD